MVSESRVESPADPGRATAIRKPRFHAKKRRLNLSAFVRCNQQGQNGKREGA
jgi:hypothetical protein